MSCLNVLTRAASLTLTLGLATAALAQTPVQPQPRAPNMPAPQSTVPEKVEPGATGTTGTTLSDKLQRSDGVIHPPGAADATITTIKPAPDFGTMPVIPPPGSPGGNQNVQPK
jgi:hypothetical protein